MGMRFTQENTLAKSYSCRIAIRMIFAATLNRKAVKKMRLIDADKLAAHLERRIEYAPTIDPETLPIVRQLREELALITHQRDVYKSVFERITAHGDCNDCGKAKECQFAPKCGEDTRYNCPLWRGPQKEG